MRTKWIVYELTKFGTATQKSEAVPPNESKAQRKRVLIREEEQRSGTEFSAGAQARDGNEGERMLVPTKVKLIRAQGECLGIRSR